jgi:hypothetical protein
MRASLSLVALAALAACHTTPITTVGAVSGRGIVEAAAAAIGGANRVMQARTLCPPSISRDFGG